ncbi:MAG: GNAT family N-acetyltransferase [Streptococcaceae bacterium]|nr:GNAT family N-acetyltransferase [Streptococcaceae bacterium]
MLPDFRGKGYARLLMDTAIDFAGKHYKALYLDTDHVFTTARKLYEKYNFTYLDAPLPATIHNACDTWMLLKF